MRTTKNLDGEINYYKLKVQTAQQILRLLDKNWSSYFRSIKDYKTHPQKYKGVPKAPDFRKSGDMNLLIYTNQNARIRSGKIILANDLTIEIPEYRGHNFTKFSQIRILPRKGYYKIEIIYEKDCLSPVLDQDNFLSIDLGVDNLASCITKDRAFILSGKTIKSVNQWYNKTRAEQRSFQDKKGKDLKICNKKFSQLSFMRSTFIRDQFHKMSRLLINYCLENKIGTLVVGYNVDWKDSINIGKVSNQKFAAIPYKSFLKFLEYKCKLVGIIFISNEESYTSKCDGLALEELGCHGKYLGQRKERGIFQSSTGRLINADINGALNILRKVIGDSSFIKEIVNSVVLFNPVKIRFPEINSGQTLSNLLLEC
jgi:IS605 OrfB family transposase